MNSLGVQPAHRICSDLLIELCGASTQPRALVDPGGNVVVASELFRAIAAREPGLARLLEGIPAALRTSAETWLDDGWLVVRAASLEGSALASVQLYGPAVVRARLGRIFDARLSAREGECLALALEGAENGVVAARLGVRPERSEERRGGEGWRALARV